MKNKLFDELSKEKTVNSFINTILAFEGLFRVTCLPSFSSFQLVYVLR